MGSQRQTECQVVQTSSFLFKTDIVSAMFRLVVTTLSCLTFSGEYFPIGVSEIYESDSITTSPRDSCSLNVYGRSKRAINYLVLSSS